MANNTAPEMPLQGSPSEEVPEEILREQEMAKAGEEHALSNYSQKVIEQKEKELRELVMLNYSRIRDVERELSQLQLQLKLTAGPKKHALEMMRKKIETQNEKVASVRQRYNMAKQTFLSLEAELKREEAAKEQLCSELNTLVQQSATLQLNKLEELKRQLEGLTAGVATNHNHPGEQQLSSAATMVQGQAQVAAAAAVVAENIRRTAEAVAADGNLPAPAASQGGAASGGGAQSPQAAAAAVAPDADGAGPGLPSTRSGTANARRAQPSPEQQQQDEAERQRLAEQAAAARSRHIGISPAAGQQRRAAGPPGGAAAAPPPQAPLAPPRQKAPSTFAGFDT